MPFSRYNTKVRIGAAGVGPGGTDLILPVTSLTITPEPYTGTGEAVVTLFDGRRKLEPPTWGYRVEMTWAELRGDQDVLRKVIVHLLSNDGADLYVEHLGSDVFDATKVIPAVIPQLSGGEIVAQFEAGGGRKRPGTLSLVTKSQADASVYTWLTT